MIMDGATLKSGAVAGLRRVRSAISVARNILEHTTHTLLVGDLATDFAVRAGFSEEDLSTAASKAKCSAWKAAGCQPNYRINVSPDPTSSCGPYTPLAHPSLNDAQKHQASHDTVSLIALLADGSMAAGTSTNGASHKIPGRVGDGPITGSGSYVDTDVGACGATGDGDIMMRFLPCYQAVESMRRGMSPLAAAEDAVRRMLRKYPKASTGLVVVNNKGEHAAAASGWTFTYSFRGGAMPQTKVVTVEPLNPPIKPEL